MKIIFIRHAKTSGNLGKRYIGRTDEPLCDEGIADLKSRKYPNADIVICSPMKRCIRTAEIIYPNKKAVICNDLRECDFGDFEGKSYSELCENPDYIGWLNSMGRLPFPNGESHEKFTERCVNAFAKSAADFADYESAAYVVHGGTIMSVLEKFAFPKKGFYDYQVGNCCGFICDYSGGKIRITEEIL